MPIRAITVKGEQSARGEKIGLFLRMKRKKITRHSQQREASAKKLFDDYMIFTGMEMSRIIQWKSVHCLH